MAPEVGERPRVLAQLGAGLLAILGYFALACALYWPVSPFDGGHLPRNGIGDPAQMAWFLAYTPFALLHGHSPFATSLIDYPSGVNLAANTTVPLLGVALAPVTLALGPVAAFNFGLRIALALSAAAAAFVARRLGCRRSVALLAGALFGFGPYLVNQAEGNAHLDLAFAGLLPLLFYAALRLAERPGTARARDGLLLGSLAGAQFLIDPEALAQAVIVGAAVACGWALLHPRAALGHLRRVAGALLGATVVATVLAAWPAYCLVAGAGHLRGPVQSSAHLQSYAADLLEPVAPTSRELIDPGFLRGLAHFATRNVSELGGYLGIPLVMLALAALLLAPRRRAVASIAALGAIAFVASLGSRLSIHGRTTSLPLPESLLPHLPLLASVVPARFGVEVALGAALLGAIATEELLVRFSGRGARIALLGAIALVLLGVAPSLPLGEGALPWPAGTAATIGSAVPAGSLVLAYPFPGPPTDEAMLWQAEAKMAYSQFGGYATINGPSGAGQYWTATLPHGEVEDFFGRETSGAHSHLPRVRSVSASQLCRFLSGYHVGSVVFWPHGDAPQPVATLLNSALGSPVARDGALEVFRTSPCRS
jgi:hypothetical protein